MSICLSTFPEELHWLMAIMIYKKKISFQVHCIKYTKVATEMSIKFDSSYSAFIK